MNIKKLPGIIDLIGEKRVMAITALAGAAVVGAVGGGILSQNKVYRDINSITEASRQAGIVSGRQQVLSELQAATNQAANIALIKKTLPDTFESLEANIKRLPAVRQPLEWQKASMAAKAKAVSNMLARDEAFKDAIHLTASQIKDFARQVVENARP